MENEFAHRIPVRAMALAMALVMFIMGADLNIISPFLLDMSRSYRIPVAEAGWLVTVFAAGYAAASPLAGWMSDRTGRSPILIAGMVGFVIFETVSGWAPLLWIQVGARALAGVAAGAVSPIAYALVGDVVPKNHRAGVMSILSMGFSVATVAGVPIGLWLSTVVGWRGTLLAIGAALAVAGTALAALVSPLIPSPRRPTYNRGSVRQLLGRNWPQATASFMAFAAMGLVYTYLPTTLVRRGLAHPVWLIWVLAGYGFFNLMGNWLYGRLGDAWGAAPTVRLAQGAELVVVGLLALAARWGALPLVIALAWVYAFSQAYIPDLKALAADVPMQWRGTSLALNNTAMYGGMVAGSAVANALYPVGAFPLVAALGGVAVMLGMAGMYGARDRRQGRLREA